MIPQTAGSRLTRPEVRGNDPVTCALSAPECRRGRLVELDARYCDVIVERFERLTGERARLI